LITRYILITCYLARFFDLKAHVILTHTWFFLVPLWCLKFVILKFTIKGCIHMWFLFCFWSSIISLGFQWATKLLVFNVLFFQSWIFDNETTNWCKILLLVFPKFLSTYAMLVIMVIIWTSEIRRHDSRGLVDN
jgi:hypothetical protein